MKKRKLYLIGLSTVLLIGLAVGIIYYLENRTTYKLDLPQIEMLESISLKKNADNKIIINKQNDVQNILKILGDKRTTTKESVHDIPMIVDEIINVDFNYQEDKKSTIYVYKEDGKYFIEQPYNGIYEISQDEYNSIESNTQ